MSGPLGAMATWFPATPMGEHQRPGQGVRGNPKTCQKRAFTTFQRGGIEPDGRRHDHLIVTIQSDHDENKTESKCCNQGRRLSINVTLVIELPTGIRQRREMKGCPKQTRRSSVVQ